MGIGKQSFMQAQMGASRLETKEEADNYFKKSPRKKEDVIEKHKTLSGVGKDKKVKGKKGKKDLPYYLVGDLNETQTQKLEEILAMDEEKFESRCENNAIMKHAGMRGRKINKFILRNAQVKPALMSAVNPRFFIGDKPGLGKTVISAECYAFYCVRCLKKGLTPKKVLVVTDSAHVVGFGKDWERMGIKLIPLTKSSTGIKRALKNNDLENDFDGVVINWDGLKTNGFLEYFLENAELFGYAVFDETSKVLNNKSVIYKVTNAILNEYQGGIPRALFLNGSSFEKDIFDFYAQFSLLKPKLIPTKSFLEDRYVVRQGRNVYMKDYVYGANGKAQLQTVQRKVGEIVDYKNQEELRDRLKYYYIARSKSDYSKDLPQHNYRGHFIGMTTAQAKLMEEHSNVSALNSPKTSNPDAKFTFAINPKFKEVIEFAEETSEDRPILYVYNKESQKDIHAELTKRGYKVGILNGDTKNKQEVIELFNNYKLDMLIFNVEKAVNLPTSDRIIFYDIPTMPQRTNQIRGRIDRNNYKDSKFYDFFCYMDSPEMFQIIRLGYFRENHSNKFTGQVDYLYGILLEQLYSVYSEEIMEGIHQVMNDFDESDPSSKFEEIADELSTLIK